VGLANSGTPLGGAISGPIVGYIALHLGWRFSFIVLMIIGLVWAIACWFFAKEKPKAIDKTEIDRYAEIAPQTNNNLSYYLKQPTVLITAFAFFTYNYILFFFLTWFPSYLVDARNMSLESMSIITVIPWV
ncbi:MFS transporter, partial [Staphylococcus epidermidis]|uniref:MFS transporter n=1 Tax=Staphylococcus epidermidis TaxID=1282 RepID=UPI000D4EB8CD